MFSSALRHGCAALLDWLHCANVQDEHCSADAIVSSGLLISAIPDTRSRRAFDLPLPADPDAGRGLRLARAWPWFSHEREECQARPGLPRTGGANRPPPSRETP